MSNQFLCDFQLHPITPLLLLPPSPHTQTHSKTNTHILEWEKNIRGTITMSNQEKYKIWKRLGNVSAIFPCLACPATCYNVRQNLRNNYLLAWLEVSHRNSISMLTYSVNGGSVIFLAHTGSSYLFNTCPCFKHRRKARVDPSLFQMPHPSIS